MYLLFLSTINFINSNSVRMIQIVPCYESYDWNPQLKTITSFYYQLRQIIFFFCQRNVVNVEKRVREKLTSVEPEDKRTTWGVSLGFKEPVEKCLLLLSWPEIHVAGVMSEVNRWLARQTGYQVIFLPPERSRCLLLRIPAQGYRR